MEIMLDLETLGVSTNTMILTIAAVTFDSNNKETESNGQVFYARVDIDSYKKYGSNFTLDASTLFWWINKAPQAAKNEAFCDIDRKSIETVMKAFSDWCSHNKVTKIWSNGASFDIPIVSYTMNLLNIEIPWKFWDIRDTRTLYDLANIKLKDVKYNNVNNLPDHHALGDCYKQLEGVKQSYKKLKTVI